LGAVARSFLRLCFLALSLLGMLHAATVQGDPGYEIRAPMSASADWWSAMVKINITAPSNALIQRATVLLNGQNVIGPASRWQSGSMTG
jgi:hypothetical protein